MDDSPNSQTGMLVENGQADQPVAALPRRSRGTLLRAVFREERFFLVLSVFIGIFSGLAVVCFRFAIDWCRIYLVGSGLPSRRFGWCWPPLLQAWSLPYWSFMSFHSRVGAV